MLSSSQATVRLPEPEDDCAEDSFMVSPLQRLDVLSNPTQEKENKALETEARILMQMARQGSQRSGGTIKERENSLITAANAPIKGRHSSNMQMRVSLGHQRSQSANAGTSAYTRYRMRPKPPAGMPG